MPDIQQQHTTLHTLRITVRQLKPYRRKFRVLYTSKQMSRILHGPVSVSPTKSRQLRVPVA